jgi:hypothetical protein
MSDPGRAVVDFVRQRMQLDSRWAQSFKGGFVWWAHRLAQYVWSEPPFEQSGLRFARVHARTDLVLGYNDTPPQVLALASALRRASLSGIVRNPRDSSRLQLACGVYVHEQIRPWLQSVFALAVLLQVCEAHRLAESLAGTLGARPAWSAHPQSGSRPAPDDLLGLLDDMIRDGREASRYRGRNLLEAHATLRQNTLTPEGDETQLEARLPLGSETAVLQLSTRIGHPDLGHGLLQRLTLPHGRGGANDPSLIRLALRLNEQELTERTLAHPLGSWCPSPAGLAHVMFFPNYLTTFAPRCSGALALEETRRLRWVARHLGARTV